MVQGVFLELGSCFLAKMACISPTKSRVKHRTLKKILTFFSALSTRPISSIWSPIVDLWLIEQHLHGCTPGWCQLQAVDQLLHHCVHCMGRSQTWPAMNYIFHKYCRASTITVEFLATIPCNGLWIHNYCRVSTINVDFLQPGCRSAASGREPWLSSPGLPMPTPTLCSSLGSSRRYPGLTPASS